jgi:hypothetical protein
MRDLQILSDDELDMVSGGWRTVVLVDLGQHNTALVQQLAIAKAYGSGSTAVAENASSITQINA